MALRGQALWVILILLATVAIHLTGSLWIGYLSDDYGHLENAPSVPIFKPLERHHFSPVITLLFKMASAGVFPPLAWHSLALLVHMANTVMVFLLARTGLHLNPRSALAATAIFAAAAACYEAVVWACAIGYVMVAFPVFLAILMTLTVAHRRPWHVSLQLALLQLVALLIWDWGILLFPMVSISMILWVLPRREISTNAAVKTLLPCACVCCCVLALKSLLSYRAGYHSMNPDILLWVRILIPAPIVSLFPNMPGAFFRSTLGLLPAAGAWGLLAFFTLKNEVARLSFALYLVCWLPVLVFAGPQSRYLYLGAPFFAIASVEVLGRIPARRLLNLLLIAYVVSHIFFAIQRSRLWEGAYQSAMAVRDAITSIRVPDGRELVIVNLPDRYGPSDLTWRPFVWRNGISSFGRRFVRVSTPGCSFAGPSISVMKREHIARMYPDAAIYEVRYKTPEDWRHFEVLPFDPHYGKDAAQQ